MATLRRHLLAALCGHTVSGEGGKGMEGEGRGRERRGGREGGTSEVSITCTLAKYQPVMHATSSGPHRTYSIVLNISTQSKI